MLYIGDEILPNYFLGILSILSLKCPEIRIPFFLTNQDSMGIHAIRNGFVVTAVQGAASPTVHRFPQAPRTRQKSRSALPDAVGPPADGERPGTGPPFRSGLQGVAV